MSARINNPTIKTFEGGVAYVDVLPTKNIREDVVYGVRTYTTPTEYTVRHWRYVKGKWVGFDHTGIIKPLTITKPGTYDVANEPITGDVGEVVAGARYTYKNELSKDALAQLYSYAAADGMLHKWIITDNAVPDADGNPTISDILTKIVQVDGEYLLSTNQWLDLMTGSGQYWGQHYATAEINYDGHTYPAGWSIVGINLGSMDFSEPVSIEGMPGGLPTVLRVPEELTADYVQGSVEMWNLYREELLENRLDLENCHWMNGVLETTGTINGREYVGFDFNAAPEVLNNRPILTITPEFVDRTMGGGGGALQTYLMEVFYDFLMYSGLLGSGMELEYTEDGSLAILMPGNSDFTYVQDLTGLEITGDIEVGKWYMPADIANSDSTDFSGIGFYGYLPPVEVHARTDGYNPIIVDVDTIKPEQTKSLSITKNGSYTVTPDAGMALTGVNITTSIDEGKLEETKTVSLTTNNYTTTVTPSSGKVLSKVTFKTYIQFPTEIKSVTENGIVTPSSGKYALSQVNVNVVPALQEKTATTDGPVTADSGYYGLSKVTVNVDTEKYLIPLIEGSGEGELIIPETVTDIPAYAFYGQGYSSIVLHNDIQSIGEYAFSNCPNISVICYEGTYTEWLATGFADNFLGQDYATVCSDGAYALDGTRYTLNADAASYSLRSPAPDAGEHIEVASTFAGKPVTGIANDAFKNNTTVRSVIMPDSLTSIGERVFYGCSNLTDISIPDSVTNIGLYAFYECTGLTQFAVPANLNYIGHYAFSGCSNLRDVYITDLSAWCNVTFAGDAYTNTNPLYGRNLYVNNELITNLVIPEDMYIGAYAFAGCKSLTSITIPGKVPNIGNNAFANTTLEAIHISDLVSWCTTDFNNSFLSFAQGLYLNGELITDLVVPDGVDKIGNYAFKSCPKLNSVTLPNSLIQIGSGAFSYTRIKSINIPENVTNIGSAAFIHCTALTELNYNAKALTDFTSDNYIFKEAGKNGSGIVVTVGQNVTKIPAYLFYPDSTYSTINYGPYIVSVVFADNSQCTSIGNNAFYKCASLSTVNIPNSVTTIGQSAFNECNLNTIMLPESVTSIGQYAFAENQNLESISVATGNQVYHSANNCLIKTATNELVLGCKNSIIPEYIISIGTYAFAGCKDLMSITIPENITQINNRAFAECFNVTEINYNAMDAADLVAGNYTFLNTGRDGVGITVNIGQNVTRIPARLFCPSSSAPKITKVIFDPDCLCTSIGQAAFHSCSAIKEIRFSKNITHIYSYAFYGCSSCSIFDFSNALYVPVLSDATAFNSMINDAKIIVPDTLYDSWVSAAYWSTYAAKIIRNSERIVTVGSNPGGTAVTAINDNNECIVTATPDDGYVFNGWYENYRTDRELVAKNLSSNYIFKQRTDGTSYYYASNAGNHNSYAVCRFAFKSRAGDSLSISYKITGEPGDDGIIGALDTPLALSSGIDSSYFKRISVNLTSESAVVKMTNLTEGEHFIDIKFVMDSKTIVRGQEFGVKVTHIVCDNDFENFISTDNPYTVCRVDDFVEENEPMELYAKFEEIPSIE